MSLLHFRKSKLTFPKAKPSYRLLFKFSTCNKFKVTWDNELSLSSKIYDDEFLRETGSLINSIVSQLFDRKDLFKKSHRIDISETKINDTIDSLSTYPGQ